MTKIFHPLFKKDDQKVDQELVTALSHTIAYSCAGVKFEKEPDTDEDNNMENVALADSSKELAYYLDIKISNIRKSRANKRRMKDKKLTLCEETLVKHVLKTVQTREAAKKTLYPVYIERLLATKGWKKELKRNPLIATRLFIEVNSIFNGKDEDVFKQLIAPTPNSDPTHFNLTPTVNSEIIVSFFKDNPQLLHNNQGLEALLKSYDLCIQDISNSSNLPKLIGNGCLFYDLFVPGRHEVLKGSSYTLSHQNHQDAKNKDDSLQETYSGKDCDI